MDPEQPEMDESPEELLVTRWSRRSTAGNRYVIDTERSCRAMLIECSLQELLAGAQDKEDTYEDDSDFEAQGAFFVGGYAAKANGPEQTKATRSTRTSRATARRLQVRRK